RLAGSVVVIDACAARHGQPSRDLHIVVNEEALARCNGCRHQRLGGSKRKPVGGEAKEKCVAASAAPKRQLEGGRLMAFVLACIAEVVDTRLDVERRAAGQDVVAERHLTDKLAGGFFCLKRLMREGAAALAFFERRARSTPSGPSVSVVPKHT